QPRLAHAGLADNQDELAVARKSALRAAGKDVEVVLAADKRCEKPGSFSAPSAADPHDAEELHRRRSALKLMGALILDDEQSGDLPLNRGCDEHRSRLGRGLNARSDVGRFPEHLAGSVDDDRTALKPDTNGKLRSADGRVSAIHLNHRLLDAEGGANGSFGVI